MNIDEAIKHTREVARESRENIVNGCNLEPYESYCNSECAKCAEEHEQFAKWLEELKEYKRLEIQKISLELPCNIGDTLYVNISRQGDYMRKKNRPYEVEVVFIGINGVDNFMNVKYKTHDTMLSFRFSDIGKMIFLTKEDALEELKRMEEK